mmetsp:Transcript_20146/g.29910  ORF Transcript_20146/g.29910 Transcript_20146/m.29910 type:complete len:305 (-) Transcript_20146:814-1728(-)
MIIHLYLNNRKRKMRIRIQNCICLTLLLLSWMSSVHGLSCPVQALHKLLEPAAATTPTVVSSTPDGVAGATALELWTVERLEKMYRDSIKIKCPFFRRRASDIIEGMDMMARFLIIRHKSILDLPTLGCRNDIPGVFLKSNRHLEIATIAQLIKQDWKPSTHKGYLITGRLNHTLYRNDCFFDSPDPDMPVRGLNKYVCAARDLFDYKSSEAHLMDLAIIDNTKKIIQVRWKLQNAVLRLPWKPMLPTWTGRTTYYLDDNHLIYRHEDTWDISALEGFARTLLPPKLGDWIFHTSRRSSSSLEE